MLFCLQAGLPSTQSQMHVEIMKLRKALKKKDGSSLSGSPLEALVTFGLRPLGKEYGLIKELPLLCRFLIYTIGWLSWSYFI